MLLKNQIKQVLQLSGGVDRYKLAKVPIRDTENKDLKFFLVGKRWDRNQNLNI